MKLRLAGLLAVTLMLLLQGCTTPLTKGADRRTDGIYIEDGNIEETALARIQKKYEDKVHFNINSYNRKVLVTGEVPSEEIKQDIFRIVGTVQNVTDIYNELYVGFKSDFSARSNDGLITSNIKVRMRNTTHENFRGDSVKIVTEREIVYLLGLVTKEEGKIAIDVARTSSGVKKVVPYFEYID